MDNAQNGLDMRTFGIRMEKARCERQLTRDQLADLCDITSVHVRHMEGGNRLPSLPVFVSLCIALKVSPTYFLSDDLTFMEELPDPYDRIMKLLLEATPRSAEMIVAMIETAEKYIDQPNSD